ncbi:MAG: hypothetical protein K2N58_04875 [Treponemataceae bacterium]|nr:hypothetical protein [Treponemataceae bacterium]
MASDYQAEDVLTITGESLDDCRAKLIDMYGSAYNVISRRQVLKKCGPFGLLKKEYVEVKYVVSRQTENSLVDVSDEESLRRVKEEILRKASGGKTKEEIRLDELNSKLDDLTAQLLTMPRPVAEEGKIESIERIKEMLDDNEFSKEFINEIALRLEKEFSFEDLKDFAKVERQVVDWIGEAISIAPKKAHRPPHVVVIVGPTGVGKTTTIAKLAAQHIIHEKDNSPKMCMITIDTTRVGAEELLKRLGNVLNLNVLKAATLDDLQTVFNSIRDDYDIIYIDTSGYSPNNSEEIAKLKTTLGVENLRPDIFLAVTASTKLRDLRNIVQNYELFGYSSVIVTKCDETTRLGNIISVFHEKGKSLAYITDGQQVARHIKKANVVDFLIRLSGFNVDRIHIEDKFGE